MTPRVRAGAILLGVFLFGGVAGAGASRAYTFHELKSRMEGPPAEARARFRMEAMRRNLDLSEGQVAQIEKILGETEGERDKRMESCKPGLDELRETTEAQIREVLDEVQVKKYEEFQKERRGRRRGPPR